MKWLYTTKISDRAVIHWFVMEGIRGTGASAFSPVTVKEAAYARIQREIEAFEEVIREWREHRNTLSSIARLPPEILSHVFKCVADALMAIAGYRKLRWILVSHVCRHWRRVALECPSLWTNIPISHPHWAKEMLVRSHMAPLTIVASVDVVRRHRYNPTHQGDHCQPTSQTAVIDSLKHLPRIRALSLTQSSAPDLLADIFQYFNTAAPILNTLTISNAHPGVSTKLPNDIFPEGVPRLQHLELHGCNLSWDSSLLLGDLTCLKLGNFTPETRGSICEIIHVLSGLPNLKTLKLASVIQFSESRAAIAAPTSPATLPHLTHLHLEADIYSCASLLSHLVCSELAQIHIVWSYLPISDVGFPASSSVFHELGAGLAKGLKAPIRALEICSHSGILQTWDSPWSAFPPLRYQGASQITVMMLTHPPQAESLALKSVVDIGSELPLQDLATLHAVPLDIDAKDWVQWFGRLRSLQNIHITPQTPTSYPARFVDALSRGIVPEGSKVHKKAGRLMFKSLRCLHIQEWCLDDPVSGERGETVAERLAECFVQRCKRGVTLRQLHIRECKHVDEDAIYALKNAVGKVNWDYDEGFTEEEEDDSEPGDAYMYSVPLQSLGW
ncbi:hypothetical protein Hypma_002868 [Hypsizygus marmoreus]|uniref:F-box domain-containing protein n=1 Tax=Hypsizygus marmoreus TaxID=39966 RepID=A0A369JA56_HYPMA|nr:hypothetical protein Hypma_002868 [Hypsizygus marmoreus]